MGHHTVAEAESCLAELIDRALKGEDVVIVRDGQPAVALKPVVPTKPAHAPPDVTEADLDWLRARRVRGNPTTDAGALVSQMRDEDWR